ncbi:MAG: serine protein kinase RIO [Candidatus Methanomethylicia archaeon]|nr:serine protein kinase RIO [Candidatus Methanomethylicia archaeon]
MSWNIDRIKDELHRIDSRKKKIKDSDLFETVEEVFDYQTLMILYDLINRGFINTMYGVVNSGKEARIYWAKDVNGVDVAIKIYLTSTSEFRKGMMQYIIGDPRFKVTSTKTRDLIYVWARKEYANLSKAYEVGVRVPKPIVVKGNILVMEFIGFDGVPAPLLKDFTPQDLHSFFKTVMNYVKKLYVEAKLVHGDLSEYNIMVFNENPVLIDFGQAVNLSHPMAEELLVRDIKNLLKYFSRMGIDIPSIEEALNWVKEYGGN